MLNVDFTHSVDWSGMRETPAGVWGRGDPTGALRRGGSPGRPRTARAWSGNQQTSLTEPYKLIKQMINRLTGRGLPNATIVIWGSILR
jgi:hypothetical protein